MSFFRYQVLTLLILSAASALFQSSALPALGADNVSKNPRRTVRAKSTDNSPLSTVYVLRQRTRAGGLETVYISEKVIKVVQENAGRVTLASAPSWKMLVLNPGSKTYFESKGGNTGLLMQRYMLIEGGDLSKCKWHAVEKKKIASIDAERFVDAGAISLPDETRFDGAPEELKICGFWVASSNMKVAPGAANVLARIRGIPPIGKVPLQFIHFTKNKTRVEVLDTLSVERKSMPLGAMKVPADYTRTLTEYDGTLKDSSLLDELIPHSGGKGR